MWGIDKMNSMYFKKYKIRAEILRNPGNDPSDSFLQGVWVFRLIGTAVSDHPSTEAVHSPARQRHGPQPPAGCLDSCADVLEDW